MFALRHTEFPSLAIVAAARPNFMKVAPIMAALGGEAETRLVHTGQHYDERMSGAFFSDLGIPEPHVNLGVGSGSHASQTAGVMVAFEAYLESQRPDAVVVVGDVNSTVAASLAAVKLHIPVAHVEAGLRSRDWYMPEEANRVVTDRLSQWLFTTSEAAADQLRGEGAPDEAIHFVGNVMIDTLLANLLEARERGEKLRRNLGFDDYCVMTLHRPSNVDEGPALSRLLEAIDEAVGQLPVVFPAHPRTVARLQELDVAMPSSIRIVEPLGYLDFIGLVDSAQMVLTDSGGLQEETSVLGIPCLTLRDNTERPITCEMGTNELVGTNPEDVALAVGRARERGRVATSIPRWDGHAGPRIAKILLDSFRGA